MKTAISKMIHRCIIILASAFLLPQILFAQYEKDMLTLIYTNTSGEKGRTTYIYNGLDLPYKAVWELDDGSRRSINYHTFDQKGLLVEKHREFSDSIFSHQIFNYDREGHLIHETFKRSDGITGEVDYIYRDNLCQVAKCRRHNGWFTGDIRYYYDQHEHKDSALIYQGDMQIGRINYEYDNRGRLGVEHWEFNSGFGQTMSYNYLDRDCILYRSSNVFIKPSCSKRIQKEIYDFNGQGGGPSYYEYDTENRLLKKTFERSDGLKTTSEYHYLGNGLLERSVRHYNDGTTGIFTYLYNEPGQLTERDFIKSDGSTAFEKYNYDSEGRLISGSWHNVDGWLSGNLLFSHDRFDNIREAEFRGENMGNAIISFTYGETGDLQKIHWLFEDGITQTYQFFYMSW